MAELRPRVAITLGDAAGVGPEVCIKALADPEIRAVLRPLLVGPWEIARMAAAWSDPPLPLERVAAITEARFPEDAVEVLAVGNLTPEAAPPGRLSAAAGAAGVAAVETAAKLALAGTVEAVVTAPLNKEAMRLAGVAYPGHTEILADLAGSRPARMLLVSGNLRVCHVTVHVSLRQALDLIHRERIVATIRDAAEGLRRLGIEKPRLAVAGLNPHAGEAGLFGTEEIEEIAPACEESTRGRTPRHRADATGHRLHARGARRVRRGDRHVSRSRAHPDQALRLRSRRQHHAGSPLHPHLRRSRHRLRHRRPRRGGS
jgi:4-hydroxythreonine-4-phosphate dehydrogenase